MGSPKNKYGGKFKKISERKNRIIIDLRIKGLSLNDIVDHFRQAYRIKITIYYIKKLIKKCNNRAKRLNRFYDSLVSDMLDFVEFDEVYQGREGKILGGVHKDSLYLITMERFHTKSKEELKEILTPIAIHFPKIQIVFTDLLPAYKSVIEEVFVGSLHQNCCVHAIRDVKNEIFPINSAANKAYKALKKLEENLTKQKGTLKKKKRKLKNFREKLANKVIERKKHFKLNKLTLHSKLDPKDTIRIQLNEEINSLHSCIRSLNKTISNIEDKIIKFTHNIPSAKEKYTKKLVKRLQAGKLLKKFKDLLYSDPKAFNKKYERFLLVIGGKKSKLAKFLKKFIKNNPKLFTLLQSEFDFGISSNFKNTNSIESIYGRKRAFLDKFRTILGSEFQESIFEILRLHHNFSNPYTGPRNDTSPLERLGIHSKYDNYLDALFGCKIA